MVEAFGAAVDLWVIRFGSHFVDAQQTVDGRGEFGSELKAFVRDEGSRTFLQGDVVVDEDVGGALAVNLAAVTANMSAWRLKRSVKGETQNVGIPKGCWGQRPKELKNANPRARGIR